jgi:hypothetical protein
MKVNIKRLRELCEFSENELWEDLATSSQYHLDGGAYLYQDNGNNILAVAHLDTVLDYDSPFRWIQAGSDTVVLSPNLDDRLGVFIILELLPQLQIPVDILFTTGEESCTSTAQDFAQDCNKKYSWIVEFDRAGNDVVLYQYDEVPELTEDLQSAGFKIGKGSYTDICALEELGIGAFNVGIGYHFQHSDQCCASLQEMLKQLYKFQDFFKAYGDKQYEYKPRPMLDHDYWFGNKWEGYNVMNPVYDDMPYAGKRKIKRRKKKSAKLWIGL